MMDVDSVDVLSSSDSDAIMEFDSKAEGSDDGKGGGCSDADSSDDGISDDDRLLKVFMQRKRASLKEDEGPAHWSGRKQARSAAMQEKSRSKPRTGSQGKPSAKGKVDTSAAAPKDEDWKVRAGDGATKCNCRPLIQEAGVLY